VAVLIDATLIRGVVLAPEPVEEPELPEPESEPVPA
jgi:hypothetical protein